MTSKHIHIMGASGSGVTTLGKAVANHLSLPHFDTDDFYWLPTQPPYTEKYTIEERLKLLDAALSKPTSWVLSGSLAGWGDPLNPLFDLVVFLKASTQVRIERLRKREAAKYGSAIAPSGSMYAQHEKFIKWAESYDAGTMTGRSLSRHTGWIANLSCPVLQLDGNMATDCLLKVVVTEIYYSK